MTSQTRNRQGRRPTDLELLTKAREREAERLYEARQRHMDSVVTDINAAAEKIRAGCSAGELDALPGFVLLRVVAHLTCWHGLNLNELTSAMIGFNRRYLGKRAERADTERKRLAVLARGVAKQGKLAKTKKRHAEALKILCTFTRGNSYQMPRGRWKEAAKKAELSIPTCRAILKSAASENGNIP